MDKLPSEGAMECVARQLGAPSASEFLRVASPSLKCAFKLTCLMRDEIETLRQIVSDSAAALKSGAIIMPSASLEFMALLPREIELRIAALASDDGCPSSRRSPGPPRDGQLTDSSGQPSVLSKRGAPARGVGSSIVADGEGNEPF